MIDYINNWLLYTVSGIAYAVVILGVLRFVWVRFLVRPLDIIVGRGNGN